MHEWKVLEMQKYKKNVMGDSITMGDTITVIKIMQLVQNSHASIVVIIIFLWSVFY